MMGFVQYCTMKKFLLTRLLRGVTTVVSVAVAYLRISTHTPLARRDPEIGL